MANCFTAWGRGWCRRTEHSAWPDLSLTPSLLRSPLSLCGESMGRGLFTGRRRCQRGSVCSGTGWLKPLGNDSPFCEFSSFPAPVLASGARGHGARRICLFSSVLRLARASGRERVAGCARTGGPGDLLHLLSTRHSLMARRLHSLRASVCFIWHRGSPPFCRLHHKGDGGFIRTCMGGTDCSGNSRGLHHIQQSTGGISANEGRHEGRGRRSGGGGELAFTVPACALVS